jgi:hypothetical protein
MPALVTICLLVVFAACGGGDDNPSNDGSPDGTRTTTNGGEDGGDQTLEALVSVYLADVEGKRTYRTTSENFGEHPNLVWTYYHLGDDTRIDWRNVVANPEDDPMVSTTVIISEGGSYLCASSPGIDSCNPRTPEAARAAVFWMATITEVAEAIDAGIEGTTISSPAAREIAGVQATCFDLEVPSRIGDGPLGAENIELCYGEDGALLLMDRRVTFDDPAFPAARLTVTAEAVAEAAPSDFFPPASPLN